MLSFVTRLNPDARSAATKALPHTYATSYTLTASVCELTGFLEKIIRSVDKIIMIKMALYIFVI